MNTTLDLVKKPLRLFDAIGFALKKILKWMLIIVGFLAGMLFVGVQMLQKYGYVSTVNWDYLP